MRRHCALLALAIGLSSGCASNHNTARTTVDHRAPAPAEQARLVVAIVYDQFPAWAYDKYRELLSPDGALRRTSARGADHVVEFAFAGTHTAAGHAAIFTGVPPSQNRVGSNQVWSEERGVREIVDDGKHRIFGLADAFASPVIIKVDSVADALREAHGDRARIVGLSFKDRGAVLTTGRQPDLVLWYDKRLGTMTSSTYYGPALPEWVTDWLTENPLSRCCTDWEPRDPHQLQRLLGPDDSPGEADYRGFGTTFPHNSATSEDKNRTIRLMPQSTDYLLDLARASVSELSLGADEVPDLLVLSISGTDYNGHVFGPESWEYVDHLIRIDAAVGLFLAELENKTSVAVMITSDHGSARLPERSKETLPSAGRLFPVELLQQLNSAAAKVLGKGAWVGAYEQPIVYLTDAARLPSNRTKAVNSVIDSLEAMPVVHAAFDVQDAVNWLAHSDAVKRAVAHSLPSHDLGDVYVVPERGSVVDEGFEKGKGTSHGSPWAYDRLVPAVFSGPGVSRNVSTTPQPQNRVAATLCQLLGITPPSQILHVQPLPGALANSSTSRTISRPIQ